MTHFKKAAPRPIIYVMMAGIFVFITSLILVLLYFFRWGGPH